MGLKSTERKGSSFSLAFLFLSRARRRGLDAVYAYCRLIDDIVDEPGDIADKHRALRSWREELRLAFFGGAPTHPVALALQEAHQTFALRHEDALAVLEGCEMDLVKERYQTWDELRRYCYLVASAVGLLCIRVFGHRHPGSAAYAIHLGLALQLTNILRDVAEDARRGRIYLPLSDLADFGVREEDLLMGRYTDGVRRLLRAYGARAKEHYQRARAALPGEDRRVLLPAEIMGGLYHALLREIERRDFDVLSQKGPVALRRRQKLAAVSLSLLGAAFGK